MTAAAEVDAPAKVNLRLRILAREASGYHSLESLFCAIGLGDSVRVERSGEGVEIAVQGGVETGPVESNLAVRATRRFLAEIGRDGDGIRIALHKRIPSAAGLGGGSSDAAAVLRALNRLYGRPLPSDSLLQLGIELGSDVPFFLCGSPLALGWSRGERLLALPPLDAATVLVAHSGEPMPTGGAFQRIAELRGGEYRPRAVRLRLEDLTSWSAVAHVAANDFEVVAREALPRTGEAIDLLRSGGAAVALLAGSGASVFGVFPQSAKVDPAERALQALGFRTWRTKTLTTVPEVRTPLPGTG